MNNQAVSAETREVAMVLEEMAGTVAAAQGAVLHGRLEELEASLHRQRELCGELEACLRAQSLKGWVAEETRKREVSAAAARVNVQNRVFAAVLRRMRVNLEMLRNARRATSLAYEAPARERKL